VSRVAIDAGPLVALLNTRDAHHQWTRELFGEIQPPFVTCEAVLSEACFLVSRLRGDADAVMAFVERGIVQPSFRLADELAYVRKLMSRYASVPMSLADACLVRMTELDAGLTVMTLDADFRIYRRNGRQVVPLMTPS
jgi:predicted nucleic acid-binding protein